ncbi:MAG: thiol:disulfide interchange protein DsbA/DsbL, partial [Gammaproteobacteria bacterium]|nr:thiol:disulfide interchange protein DsbA/DsbL [Gammaproteobacteria bacterium]
AKIDTRVTRARTTIFAFAVVVVVLIIGYGTLYSTGITEGEFVAGEHYRLIENPPRRRPGEAIKVTEFFSYGCIHCRNFDPMLEDWQKSMPEGASFLRSPVTYSPAWSLLGQAYLTLEMAGVLDENHSRIFRAIHDNGRQFQSADAIADFVDGHGIDKESFLRTFNSPQVRQRLRQQNEEQRQLTIPSVPTLMVAGKYLVNMDAGRKTALDVVDYLIAMEKAAEDTPATETASTEP